VINFFRGNSIVGTLILAILFLFTRIPAYILGVEVSPMEIKYMALAEKMASGEWLYLDIWDNTAPLSAFFYTLLYSIFGKSHTIYLVIAGVLVFTQAIQWNYWLVRTKMYQERNQIPAIVYLLLASLWIDCYTLSPELMANTFLIIALGNVLLHLNEQSQGEKSFEIGVYIGIATMFHLPYYLFLIGIILSFLLFSGTRFKDYVLLCLGTLLPFALISIGFYFKDGFDTFVSFFVFSFVKIHQNTEIPALTYLTIIAIPCILLFFSFLALLQSVGFINYQVRCQQTMLILLIFGVIGFFINTEISIVSTAILWCSASFFIAHLFLMFKKRLLRDVVFSLFVITSVGINYAFLLKVIPKSLEAYYPPQKKLIIPPIKGQKVWVLSNDWRWYLYNQAATPFFHWELSKNYLQKVDYYDIQADIYDRLQSQMPDIILGDTKTIENLLKNLPTIALQYKKEGDLWRKIPH
jgi:hypothetical protein